MLSPVQPLKTFSTALFTDLCPQFQTQFTSLKAQRLKKIKILQSSSEIENIKRPTHQTLVFCGEFWRSGLKISSEIEIFKRDWKFQSRLFFLFNLWAIRVCLRKECLQGGHAKNFNSFQHFQINKLRKHLHSTNSRANPHYSCGNLAQLQTQNEKIINLTQKKLKRDFFLFL